MKVPYFCSLRELLFFEGVDVENSIYCKVAVSNTFRTEALAGFFRLLMKGIFDPYVL